MVAVSTRLPESEAKAFEEMVRRRSVAATGTADGLSGAAVLRGLIKAAVETERGPQQAARVLELVPRAEEPVPERYIEPIEAQVEEPVPRPQKGSRR